MKQRRSQFLSASDSGKMLETLLALDRTMVEISMRLFNLPPRQRSLLRGHNRRLHRAVRQEQAGVISDGITPDLLPLLEGSRKEAAGRTLYTRPRRRPRRFARPTVHKP